jgi:serine/threonine protein kinase/Tfp pilus assembly protein PilF
MNPVFIGRYKILEEVGRGGMGIVYKAEDPSLERMVAIKILPPKLLKNKEALRRFLREAKVAAKLEHPHILPIYDIGEDGEIYYMVMEYLEGETLREWLESRQEISLEGSLNLFKQAAEALHYAHQKRVVHRDVKPENIMVLRDGTVKVMDFGIAVMEDRHSVTQPGAVMGTIAYLSPEQAEGKQADLRSDIYSLGIVLFELLTGSLPFDARTPSEMLSHHLSTLPPLPSKLNSFVPEVLDQVVLKTLAKNPADRYQTVGDLLQDLEKGSSSLRSNAGFLGPAVQESSTSETKAPPPGFVDKTAVLEELKNLLSKDKDKQEGFSRDSFIKFNPVVDRLQKQQDLLSSQTTSSVESGDEVVSEKGKEIAQVPCPRCGTLGDSFQKYCLECGSLLASAFISDFSDDINQGIALYQQGAYEQALHVFQKFLKNHSAAAEVHYYSGLCFLNLQHYTEAKSELLKALKIEPDNGHAWESLGDIEQKLNHDLDALDAYKKAAPLIARISVWQKLEKLQEKEGDFESASQSLEQALELDPKNVSMLRSLARVLIRLSRLEEANMVLKKVLDLNPNDSEALTLLGEIYERTNRFSQAIKLYEKAFEIDPENTSALSRLGDLNFKQDKRDEAIVHLKKAVKVNPENPGIHSKLAEVYLQENQEDLAFDHLVKAASLNPNDPVVLKDLGKLYLKQNSLDQAFLQFKRAVSLNPSDAEAHASLAQIHFWREESGLAVQEYKTALQYDPYNPEIHESLGLVYYMQENLDNAIEEMLRAVSYDPNNTDYRKALGVMYETRGKLDLARKEYQKVVELKPGDALAQGLLGRVYAEQNLLNLAIYQYQKSLELEPRTQLVHNLLGKAFLKLGKLDEAILSFQKAIDSASQPISGRAKQIVGKNYYYLGKTYMEKALLKEAETALEKASQYYPSYADIFHLLGKIKAEQGLKAEAKRHMERAARLAKREETEIFADFAEILLESGDQGGAIQAILNAIHSAPQQAKYHAFLGDLFFTKGELESALSSYETALKLAKQKKDVYHWKLANVLMHRKEYNEAAGHYKAARDLTPGNWHYSWDLAKAYEMLGKRQDALEQLERLKQSQSDPETLNLIDQEIKRLQL